MGITNSLLKTIQWFSHSLVWLKRSASSSLILASLSLPFHFYFTTDKNAYLCFYKTTLFVSPQLWHILLTQDLQTPVSLTRFYLLFFKPHVTTILLIITCYLSNLNWSYQPHRNPDYPQLGNLPFLDIHMNPIMSLQLLYGIHRLMCLRVGGINCFPLTLWLLFS